MSRNQKISDPKRGVLLHIILTNMPMYKKIYRVVQIKYR